VRGRGIGDPREDGDTPGPRRPEGSTSPPARGDLPARRGRRSACQPDRDDRGRDREDDERDRPRERDGERGERGRERLRDRGQGRDATERAATVVRGSRIAVRATGPEVASTVGQPVVVSVRFGRMVRRTVRLARDARAFRVDDPVSEGRQPREDEPPEGHEGRREAPKRGATSCGGARADHRVVILRDTDGRQPLSAGGGRQPPHRNDRGRPRAAAPGVHPRGRCATSSRASRRRARSGSRPRGTWP
jgi:hypothetical protein